MILRGWFLMVILFIITACSTDSTVGPAVDSEVLDDGSNNITELANITHIRDSSITHSSNFDYEISDYNLNGNKIVSKTKTEFSIYSNGQQTTPHITTHDYSYNNGNLVSTGEDFDGQMHYDSLGRLEWADNDNNEHYHYLYPESNIVQCQVLTSSFGSGNATVTLTITMTFSSYGNLITVENDSGSDELPKLRFVLRNGNVTKIKGIYLPPVMSESNVKEITYTTAVSTANIVKANTYGRKNYLLLNAHKVAAGDVSPFLTRNYIDTSPGEYHVDFYTNGNNYIKRTHEDFLSMITHYTFTRDYTIE